MFSLLFHKDVFYPTGVKEVVEHCERNFIDYTLSDHIINNIVSVNDRSHDYVESEVKRCLEGVSNNANFEAFEVELSKSYHRFGKKGWFITKYCIRLPLSENEDLVVVIRPSYDNQGNIQPTKNKIVTAWINATDDAHFTLDGSKYTSKEDWILANKKGR